MLNTETENKTGRTWRSRSQSFCWNGYKHLNVKNYPWSSLIWPKLKWMVPWLFWFLFYFSCTSAFRFLSINENMLFIAGMVEQRNPRNYEFIRKEKKNNLRHWCFLFALSDEKRENSIPFLRRKSWESNRFPFVILDCWCRPFY